MPTLCIDPTPNWWIVNKIPAQPIVVDFPPLQSVIKADFFAEIREANSTAPATVIDNDDAFAIDIHINLTLDTPLSYLLCGYWCISVCLESLCGDKDYRFPQDTGFCCILVPLSCDQSSFDTTICVPGGTVTESECGGTYEGTVIVTLLSTCRRRGKENASEKDPATFIPVGAAGSFQLPLLTFYDDTGGVGE